MSSASKFLVIFLVAVSFFALLITLSTTASAQVTGTPYTAGSFKAPEAVTYTNLNVWSQSIPCFGIGVSLIPNHTCPAYNATGNLVGVEQATAMKSNYSILGGLNYAMQAMAMTPPTSTHQYVANLGADFGLIPRAQAQVPGSGSGVIGPVYRLWAIMRDVSYLLFIFVFIIIGFMIMFRQRLNPQTVITFQSALPGLVIGLILVTFSYFIAALMIDVSFLVLQIINSLFVQAGDNTLGSAKQLFDLAQNPDLLKLIVTFVLNRNTIDTVTGPIVTQFGSFAGGITPTGLSFGPIGPVLGVIVGGVFGGLITTILIIGIIFQMIRLVWSLLQCYISIFVNVILGPIFILYSTLPGRRGALSFWWKNILGNALVFPAVYAAFLFAGLIVGTPIENFNASLPLMGFPTGLLRGILAFGIVLATPAIPKAVKGAIGVKDIGEFSSAAMAGAAAGGAAFGAASGAGYGAAMERMGMPYRKKYMMAEEARRSKPAQSKGWLGDTWARRGPGVKS